MLRKFIAILLSIIVLVLLPVIYLGKMNDNMVNNYVESKVNRFSSRIMAKNEISKTDYLRLNSELAQTNRVFDVNIDLMKKKEVLVASENGIISDGERYEVGIITSEGYVESDIGVEPEIEVFLVYSDDTKEVITDYECNFDPNRIGLQFVTLNYHDFQANIEVNVKGNFVCDICGSTCEYDNSFENGCEICRNTPIQMLISPDYVTVYQNDTTDITVMICYLDGHIELVNDYEGEIDTSQIGEQSVSLGYQGIVEAFILNVIERGDELDEEGKLDEGNDLQNEFELEKDDISDDEDNGLIDDNKEQETNNKAYEKFIEQGYGSVKAVSDMIYTNEIIEFLRNNPSYYVEPDSFYSIKVKQRTNTKGVLDYFLGNPREELIICGGMT